MLRFLIAATVVGMFALSGTESAAAPPKHPRLHHAILEMREANRELKDASNNFGGHKMKAMTALDNAVAQIEKALLAVGDPYQGYNPPRDIYAAYKNHPHLRHAAHALAAAQKDLTDNKSSFGGHKQKALDAIDVALEEVNKCIEHAR